MKLRLPTFQLGSFKTLTKVVLIFIGIYLVVVLGLMWWWDYEPDTFDVVEVAQARATANQESLVTGYVNKRGGYLSNDVFPPGVWMDNVPNWEFGVLVQVRDFGRALRIDFSRSQSQSNEDSDLAEAEGKFFYDNSSWLFPQSESEYEEGIRYLEGYLARLSWPGLGVNTLVEGG